MSASMESVDWTQKLAHLAEGLLQHNKNDVAAYAATAAGQGLVQLLHLNETHAATCLRVREATKAVLDARREHEKQSLGLQNKRYAAALARVIRTARALCLRASLKLSKAAQ